MAKPSDDSGIVKYDALPRGAKQEIDLKRRKDLADAKAAPKSRAGDTVSDAVAAMGGYGLMPGKGGARAGYKAGREDTIRKAQAKADYEDVKRPSTTFAAPKGTKGMSYDKLPLRDMVVDQSTRHHKASQKSGSKK